MDISKVIDSFITTIQSGGVALMPSDTCYGLFCDATNPKAIAKVFQIKQRDKGRPVSMIVSGREMAEEYIAWDDQVEKMWNDYIPGPFTLIVPTLANICIPISMDHRIGIRIPDYELLMNAVQKIGKPIVATSANTSGKPAHYDMEGLKNDLDFSLIDYVFDGGVLPPNPASTLVIWNPEKTKIKKR